jgi:hypothetical protein
LLFIPLSHLSAAYFLCRLGRSGLLNRKILLRYLTQIFLWNNNAR